MKFYTLASGSSGNAAYLLANGTKILIDCGMSGKKLEEAMNAIGEAASELSAILITHEHSDHIKGAGVMARRYKLPIYATEGTLSGLDRTRIPDSALHIIKADREFCVGDIGITPFSIPHDAAEPTGFRLTAGADSVAVATDIGQMNEYIMDNIRGCRAVVLESNHDIEMLKCGPYPYPLKRRILSELGHMSNAAAAEILEELVEDGAEHIALGHLSKENNRPDIAMMESKNALESCGIRVGSDVILNVADRYIPTEVYS